MKKCYIAGKIGGLSEDEYTANFSEAESEVKKMGMKAVNPVNLPHQHGRSWEEYMKEDLTALLACDCIYVQRNWMDSKGAIVEVNTALSVGIKVIMQRLC